MLTSHHAHSLENMIFFVAKMATVAGETTQQQGYLTETNYSPAQRCPCSYIPHGGTERRNLQKPARGWKWGENTHELHQLAWFVAMETKIIN